MPNSAIPEKISFTSHGAELVGDLFVPAGGGTPGPAVVVTGSWTTVKEQMAGRYARGLAENGITAFAFDFRGYGESGGAPRDFESPEQKSEDIRAAVGYLRSRADVDGDRIGALGVCAGAGYTAVAATLDSDIRSLALVAPWLHNSELVAGLYGGQQRIGELVALGEAAAERYQETGTVEYVPAVSTEDPNAAMYGPFDYYLDPARGAIPQWGNRFAVMAWPGWLTFDPIAAAPGVSVPTLLVHSHAAAIPEGAERFHAALPADKELRWLPADSQFDFYDREDTVTAALDAVAEHFGKTL